MQDRHPKMRAAAGLPPLDGPAEPFSALCARLRAEAEGRKAHDTEHTTALMTVYPAEMLRLLDRLGT